VEAQEITSDKEGSDPADCYAFLDYFYKALKNLHEVISVCL